MKFTSISPPQTSRLIICVSLFILIIAVAYCIYADTMRMASVLCASHGYSIATRINFEIHCLTLGGTPVPLRLLEDLAAITTPYPEMFVTP